MECPVRHGAWMGFASTCRTVDAWKRPPAFPVIPCSLSALAIRPIDMPLARIEWMRRTTSISRGSVISQYVLVPSFLTPSSTAR